MASCLLLELPPETWQDIASFLPAPDLLNYLSSHRLLHNLSQESACFWLNLSSSQQQKKQQQQQKQQQKQQRQQQQQKQQQVSPARAKQQFLLEAYTFTLPSVQWLQIRDSERAPSAREGHLACELAVPGYSNKLLVVTGGFTDDIGVYIKNFDNTTTAASADWMRIEPTGRAGFTYGASLTPIPDTSTAVRFGGFQGGGYSGATSQVAVLELMWSVESGLRAAWRTVQCPIQSFSLLAGNSMARAYHTATLLQDRYLLILGGMKESGSILDPILLDLQSWQWLDQVVVGTGLELPSGRHGHSLVWDSQRSRLVLFGGGSGSDLLRSGKDNSQVWQLKSTKTASTQDNENLLASFPWEWQLLHDDPGDDWADADEQEEDADEQEEGEEEEGENVDMAEQEDSVVNVNRLSNAERLNLGRIHVGVRVSPQTVVFCFGSGRPSTNGVLAYNLEKDEFFRPAISGPLPTPRFTAASVLFEGDGYLFVHGGFTSQYGGSISDICILDLAPGLRREFRNLRVNPNARSHASVTVETLELVFRFLCLLFFCVFVLPRMHPIDTPVQ
jgi:hypothetical protein